MTSYNEALAGGFIDGKVAAVVAKTQITPRDAMAQESTVPISNNTSKKKTNKGKGNPKTDQSKNKGKRKTDDDPSATNRQAKVAKNRLPPPAVTRHIEQWHVVLGDTHARADRTTIATMLLRDIKEEYKIKYKGKVMSTWIPNAIAELKNRLVTEKFPDEAAVGVDDIGLVLVHFNADDRLNGPLVYGYPNDEEATYGIAKEQDALDFFLRSRDPPRLARELTRHRMNLNELRGCPVGQRPPTHLMDDFQATLNFFQDKLDKAMMEGRASLLSKNLLENLKPIPALKKQWNLLNDPELHQTTVPLVAAAATSPSAMDTAEADPLVHIQKDIRAIQTPNVETKEAVGKVDHEVSREVDITTMEMMTSRLYHDDDNDNASVSIEDGEAGTLGDEGTVAKVKNEWNNGNNKSASIKLMGESFNSREYIEKNILEEVEEGSEMMDDIVEPSAGDATEDYEPIPYPMHVSIDDQHQQTAAAGLSSDLVYKDHVRVVSRGYSDARHSDSDTPAPILVGEGLGYHQSPLHSNALGVGASAITKENILSERAWSTCDNFRSGVAQGAAIIAPGREEQQQPQQHQEEFEPTPNEHNHGLDEGWLRAEQDNLRRQRERHEARQRAKKARQSHGQVCSTQQAAAAHAIVVATAPVADQWGTPIQQNHRLRGAASTHPQPYMQQYPPTPEPGPYYQTGQGIAKRSAPPQQQQVNTSGLPVGSENRNYRISRGMTQPPTFQDCTVRKHQNEDIALAQPFFKMENNVATAEVVDNRSCGQGFGILRGLQNLFRGVFRRN